MISDSGQLVQLTIDGEQVEVHAFKDVYDSGLQRKKKVATTIFDAAVKLGKKIPILCHREYMDPVAVCRVCCVEIRAGGKLVPACYQPVQQGMEVKTHTTSDRVQTSVQVLTELLMADHPAPCAKHREHGDCELELLAEEFGVKANRFPGPQTNRPIDDSSLVIAVDHNACILCDRCVRGCDDIRQNDVIARMGKGYSARIAFDLNGPMGSSTCVACGECMVSCPTGALINRGTVKQEPEEWKNQPRVPTDELVKLDLFEGVSHPFMQWNEGAVVRRQLKKGEIICREGEFGSTAFYIEKGKVNIFIESPIKHAKSSKGALRGLFRRFTTGLVSRADDTRKEETNLQYINIDAPVALKYDDPVATLDAGELFGEMTCMSHYPRSATVQAAEDCTVLEMFRNVLYILQRSKKSREMLDERYRKRALDSHLRSVPIFSGLLQDEQQFLQFVDFLRDRVELVRLDPGQLIFRQGDPADNFYLVRIGFVKISQTHPVVNMF